MSLFTLYILTRLDAFHGYFIFLSILSGVVLIAITIATFACYAENEKEETKKMVIGWLKKALIIFISISALVNFTPTNKDLTIILGGYYVTNSEQIKELPDNVVGAINSFLGEYADKAKETIKHETVKESKDVAKSGT